jgi:hypothetical protein
MSNNYKRKPIDLRVQYKKWINGIKVELNDEEKRLVRFKKAEWEEWAKSLIFPKGYVKPIFSNFPGKEPNSTINLVKSKKYVYIGVANHSRGGSGGTLYDVRTIMAANPTRVKEIYTAMAYAYQQIGNQFLDSKYSQKTEKEHRQL